MDANRRVGAWTWSAACRARSRATAPRVRGAAAAALASAQSAGLSASLVVDMPHATRARKLFLVVEKMGVEGGEAPADEGESGVAGDPLVHQFDVVDSLVSISFRLEVRYLLLLRHA